MRGSRTTVLRVITAIVAVIAVVGYAMVQVPEPPGRIAPPAVVSDEPEPSNFVASGGLLPDGAPTVPDAADSVGQASVKHPESTEPATF